MHFTVASYRAAACSSAQLQLFAGFPGVLKGITGDLGSEWVVRQKLLVQDLARKRDCLLWLHCAVLLEIALSGLEYRQVWGACGTKQHS